MIFRPHRLLSQALVVVFLLSIGTGCSVKRMAVNSVADALTSGSSSFGADDDPALVGDALPFALLTLESLAKEAPRHAELRLALAAGFTQYAYGWTEQKATCLKYEDYDAYVRLLELARQRYLRGTRWGLEGLALREPDVIAALKENPSQAASRFTLDDVSMLYWTGASWLAAISISADRPDLIGQLPQPIALLERALALAPDTDAGGLHEIFVALDMARGEGAGGGTAKALAHYERALLLSEGKRASVFVGYATSIAVRQQDRAAFVEALNKALAMDPAAVPEWQVSNLLAQERARYLLSHVDDLFEGEVEP